jgi:D-alanyl-D-alanine carboxypeptidase (penicillin-binding protein 5/6)
MRMSMRDLGVLAIHLIGEFPDYYGYFAMTEFAYDGRTPDNRFNRNPLLGLGIGADGLKTGHTEEAGYGLVGSAIQNGRRIVFVVSGLPDMQVRAEESEKIVNWAFREFAMRTIAKKGTRIAEADVFLGEASRVGLVAADDVTVLLPSLVREAVTGEVRYTGPIHAPVEAGQKLAELVVAIDGHDPAVIPLVAETAVARGGFVRRMTAAAKVLSRRVMEMAGS